MIIKKINALFISCFWIFPFFFFISGYLTVRSFLHKQLVPVPQLVGSNIADAIKALSAQKLNARILDQKEDLDMPEGTVISQSPMQNVKLKIGQPVFIVTTRRPPKSKAQFLYNKPLSLARNNVVENGLNLKSYLIPSNLQKNICIAQQVKPNEELNSKNIVAYFSQGKTPLRIMPNFKGLVVQDVKEFLKKYNINLNLQGDTESNNIKKNTFKRIVKEQRPLAGSLINLNKLNTVTLIT